MTEKYKLQQKDINSMDLSSETLVKLKQILPEVFTDGVDMVNTPLSKYNPDLELLIQHNDQEKFYFIAETKAANSATN